MGNNKITKDTKLITSYTVLNTLIKYWKERLYLQEWQLHVELTKDSEKVGEDFATVSFSKKTKMAVIYIKTYKSLIESGEPSKFIDMEISLVHELLHLYFSRALGLDDDTEEELVHGMARALVGARRGA